MNPRFKISSTTSIFFLGITLIVTAVFPIPEAEASVRYTIEVKIWNGASYDLAPTGSSVTFFFEGEDPAEVLTDAYGIAYVDLDAATPEDWLVMYTEDAEIFAYYDAPRLEPGVDNTLTFDPGKYSAVM
jgi:hypothetical protein